MSRDNRTRRILLCAGRAVLLALILAAPVATVGAAPQHETTASAEASGEQEAPHEQTLLQTVAKLANFGILAGVLVYFLRAPIGAHLSSRAAGIRQDLVTAAEMRSAATEQLAEIDRKLKMLPAEIEALKAQGAQDLVSEQARIAQAAAVERERLLEQTRREIATRLRVARRELTAHAAQLAVNIAETRIRQTITPDDQMRLVDRYTAQLREGR